MFFSKIFLVIIIFFSSATYGVEYSQPDTYYNNALTFYQQGDLGKAMFEIKKAYLLSPSIPHVRRLFFTIRQDIGLPPIYSTDRPSGQFFNKVFSALPPHIYALIGAIFFIGASVLVSLLILGRLPFRYSVARICIWGFFIIGGSLFIQSGIQYYIFFAPDQRVVLEVIPAYEEPDTTSTKLLDLPAGTEVTVVAQTEEFLLVRTLDGKEYWVNPRFVPVLWENLS